jgi:hypothetical protein
MMETKKLAVVVAATTAVPAFAQQEGSIPPVGPSGQYAPAGPTQQEAEEAYAGVGVVENLGGDRYGLRLGPLERLSLEGDFDFASFEGERVHVTGRFAIDETRGRVLLVESFEPVAAEEATPEEQVPPAVVTTAAVDEASDGTEGTAVVSGDASNASADASASASGGGAVQSSASPAANVLPSTGGVLPVAGLAGIVLIVGGLLVRRISR